MDKRNPKDLIRLSHSELKNHYHAENEIESFLPTKIWNWLTNYVKSRFLGKVKYQFYPSNGDNGIYPLIANTNGKVDIAIAADWASDTLESAMVGKLMRTDVNGNESLPDYSIHLGDVYYVGNPKEVEANFGKDLQTGRSDWTYGTKGFLAVPGNHEFYSTGEGFYNNLLSKTFINDISVKQKAGFFCLENEHWRIIGLDTGYTSVGIPIWEFIDPPKSQLRDEQLRWLRDEVKLGDPNDKRGLIFMSHHQYYSAFEKKKGYCQPAEQIAKIMGENNAQRPVIWYWGHQHLLSIYGLKSEGSGIPAYGRCIGHGGMPVEVPLIGKVEANKSSLLYCNLNFKDTFDDINVGYNGYVKMTLEGNVMIAKHILLEVENNNAFHKEVIEEKWTLDVETGSLQFELTDIPLPVLTFFDPN
jgi:hypothetical protein